MDFDLAAQNFIRLEKLRRAGQISHEDYTTQLGGLRVTDEQGRTWMVQEQTGQWFVWDGVQWAADAPPGREGLIVVRVAPAAAPQQAQPQAPPPMPMQPAYGPAAAAPYPQAGPAPAASAPYAQPYPQSYPQGYPQAQPQPGVGQAGGAGYVAQPMVPPNIALARKRPGCFSVTLSMLLWALVWGVAAYAVHTMPRLTTWWMYLGVGLGALGTLILWVRRITRHGRALRQLQQGGAA